MRSPLGAVLGAFTNKAPVPYVGRYGVTGGGEQRTDAASQLSQMGHNGTLFSIINKLSTSTAAVEWHMHRTSYTRSGAVCEVCEQPGVTLVDNHPALVVWNKPNDFFTRQEFVETGQQHIDLVGEAWWVVGKIGGRPIELWPVRPDRIAPVRHPTKFLSGYVYRAPEGELVPLGLDEVVMIRMPNPLDPWRGMGPVQALLSDLDAARYSAEWNARFFENSAEPGGVIQAPTELSDTTFKRLQMQWNEQHRGVVNAHRVAILEGGATWADRKYTQRDMQFTELRNLSREVIREAFGVHGHILGLSEDVNRANAEAADVSFARRLIVPRCDRIKAALNNDFLKLFGQSGKGYEFTYCSPVPEDREADNAERQSKAKSFADLVNAGVHPDDAALVVGLPPMRHVVRPQPQVPQQQEGGDRAPVAA